MVAQTMCPEPDVIHDLLTGDLSDTEYDSLSSHFDLCSECRQRFEDAASAPEFLGDVSRLCSAPEWKRETATLGRLMQDMPQQLSTAADAASMATWSAEAVSEFFEPSDDPEHIGRLGSYEVVEVIGRGGMGIVLRGIDTKLNRVVAIKVLAPELASNPNARRRFFREGQAAAAVSHDHVVTIHAVDDSERLPYLVMEFVEGESLEECVRRIGSLSVEQILRIGRQAALGLAAAHEVGLVHRDMKPANILLENGIQRVRITDFGLARAVDDVGMTQTGTVTGTPLYMSPEQARGEHVDHRTDLFSLGSVLYTMCAGRAAFRANSTVAVLKRVCDDTPRPIREVNPDIPQWLAEIVDRLMEKQPEARMQTASEVADLLGAHLAHLQDPGNVPAPVGVAEVARQTPARLRPARLLLLAVLMAFVTFGVSDALGLTSVSETFMGIVLKLTTREGTLVVEIEDPNVEVAVDGDELRVRGIGRHEIRLKPGKHQATTVRNGLHDNDQWVTIESGGKQILRVRQLPPQTGEASGRSELSGDSEPERHRPPFAEDLPRLGDDPDVNLRPEVDGVSFDSNARLQRFRGGEVVVCMPIGKLIFRDVPEQLWGQRCAMGEVRGGRMFFKVQPRTFDENFRTTPRQGARRGQRLWLLVPEDNWGVSKFEGFGFDTRESLTKRGWISWRTMMSYHATTDPDDPANQQKWAVFYKDVEPGEYFQIRTHESHTPMLVWGSTLMDGVLNEVHWDQRISLFGPGATVPLGNGHHVFDEVPEFLSGRLYTKRNGYSGYARFRVERDQRVYVAFYDWRHMHDGSAAGGWHEELTPPLKLAQMGWQEVGTMEGRHSDSEYEPGTWYIYARDCKRRETFLLRGHKYQAPLVFAELDRHIEPPAFEGIDIQLPNNTDTERRIHELVDEFNRLFKERRFAEAAVVAKQAREIDPDNPVCITMELKANFAVRVSRGEGEAFPQDDVGASGRTQPSTLTANPTIPLSTDGIVTQIAPSAGEPAVYGLASEPAPIQDFPVFFPARAVGIHEDGARQLIGQIAATVLPGDKVTVEKFERAGNVIRLNLRHEAGRGHDESRAERIEDFDLLEEVRRLTVRYEEARKEIPTQEDVKHWLFLIARHLAARALIEPDANEVRKLREQARERITTARKLYTAEAAGARAECETFPTLIDREADAEAYDRKKEVELRYIEAQVRLAQCSMVEALTEQPSSDMWADRLAAAAEEFESVHHKYRSTLAGLFARVHQGRCLQLLGNTEAATGIYDEVLLHPGTNDPLEHVRVQALHFKLMILNDSRDDRSAVINTVRMWFEDARRHRRSIVGAGILWEEALAMRGRQSPTPTRPAPELLADGPRELILRSTLKLLREVQQSPENEYAKRVADRIRDVQGLLNEGEPATAVESGFSIYIQAPLPELPAGTYRVEVTLTSDVRGESTAETSIRVAGAITAPAQATN